MSSKRGVLSPARGQSWCQSVFVCVYIYVVFIDDMQGFEGKGLGSCEVFLSRRGVFCLKVCFCLPAWCYAVPCMMSVCPLCLWF